MDALVFLILGGAAMMMFSAGVGVGYLLWGKR